MKYNLYVLTLKDGTWRICPWAENSGKQNTYYLKGEDVATMIFTQGVIDTEDPNIESKEFVAEISTEEASLAVQDALELTFKTKLHHRHNAFDVDQPVAEPDMEKYGNWSQTFIILSLEKLENDGV
ncbi:hypothetical protein NLU13_0290 [Sarocladium strictum]|uniref:Uncharacterized protein n=1 Tax=Sarocladium strictum TaxID=5046 RepID=A0AA39GNT5_SARSR|nr:hypothetical protein NLU13_0290 [Sarocladium strictum]